MDMLKNHRTFEQTRFLHGLMKTNGNVHAREIDSTITRFKISRNRCAIRIRIIYPTHNKTPKHVEYCTGPA